LGIFYERFLPADSAEFRGDVVLNNKNCASIEWRRVTETAQNLPENQKKDELISALIQTQNNVSWISSFYNELSFTSAPISIADTFQECISHAKKITMQSPALSADGSFSFIKSIFRLGDEWLKINQNATKDQSAENSKSSYGDLKIEVLKNFPAPNTNDYFQKSQKLFMEIIEREKGGSLFILSSKKAVEALYGILLPEAEKLKVKLRAVGASGGMGKSLALFLENPTGSILLSTNQILAHFDEIEDEIKVVVFQKIPFDLPFDPLVSSRSNLFRNGFKNYSLPRAIMRFREMLIDLSKNETTKTCYILDNRLLTQDYGRFFL
ncbi:MAG: helicase C-terminal domain-containing protein, partial [Patescibacteria group bacterium]